MLRTIIDNLDDFQTYLLKNKLGASDVTPSGKSHTVCEV